MPYYHFHLFGAAGRSQADDQGVFFPDLDRAYLDVHRAILDMSFEMLSRQQDPFEFRFEIADERGAVLMDVPFSEVLRPNRKPAIKLSRAFHRTVELEMQRSRVLKADLSQQIADAHATIQKTKQILSRCRMTVG